MKNKTATIKKQDKPKDYVAEMAILTQSIDKENKCLKYNDKYICHPSSITIIPNKPLIDEPSKPKPHDDEDDPKDTQELRDFKRILKSTFKNHYGIPHQKYRYPLTTSQEIGWFQNYVELLGWRETDRQ